jgi:hypothetical protein
VNTANVKAVENKTDDIFFLEHKMILSFIFDVNLEIALSAVYNASNGPKLRLTEQEKQ